MTVQELIRKTNLEQLDTKLLLRHVLKLTPTELIINNQRILSVLELKKFEELVEKLQSGMPVSYILGFKEFYSREFKVTKDTLIPRPETELLVEEVLKHTLNNAKILDLGTGTGCIAISCKLEKPGLSVTAVDKFPQTLDVAKENAKNLEAEINFICSDWYENVQGKFDVIVSNPPYIEANDRHLDNLHYEPTHALTDFADGMSHYEIITSQAKDYLNRGGYILLEHGYLQKNSIIEMLQRNNFSEIEAIQDYANLDRILIAKYN